MVQFAELIVSNYLEPCPYLKGRDACLPMRFPLRNLEAEEFDDCMAQGDRRAGIMLYRPHCPHCKACEAIRVDVARFQPNRTQRRVKRRGDAAIRVDCGSPAIDEERVALFNKHRNLRGLNQGESDIDAVEYGEFLVRSCCDTLELTFRVREKLIAVAIADRGTTSLSAVYCFFDPQCGKLSPGVYSILTQIELCRRWGLRQLYLGYYIAESSHMAYKANYRPHQRLIDGQWREFDDATEPATV
ncbi:MAG: arginyltransferase [Pirellulaceae bacterium]